MELFRLGFQDATTGAKTFGKWRRSLDNVLRRLNVGAKFQETYPPRTTYYFIDDCQHYTPHRLDYRRI